MERRTPEKEGKKWVPRCSECPGRVLTAIKDKREKEVRGNKEKKTREKATSMCLGSWQVIRQTCFVED